MPERDYSVPATPFILRAADRLYDECERAVRSGRLDARSPIGDATLDYRDMRWPDGETREVGHDAD